jgi:hypothetical protein
VVEIEGHVVTAGKQQIDKFREKARELESDPSEAAFDKALRRVAKPESDKDRQPSAGGRADRPGGKSGQAKKNS